MRSGTHTSRLPTKSRSRLSEKSRSRSVKRSFTDSNSPNEEEKLKKLQNAPKAAKSIACSCNSGNHCELHSPGPSTSGTRKKTPKSSISRPTKSRRPQIIKSLSLSSASAKKQVQIKTVGGQIKLGGAAPEACGRTPGSRSKTRTPGSGTKSSKVKKMTPGGAIGGAAGGEPSRIPVNKLNDYAVIVKNKYGVLGTDDDGTKRSGPGN